MIDLPIYAKIRKFEKLLKVRPLCIVGYLDKLADGTLNYPVNGCFDICF